ncbi:MAG: hypothetical protein JW955_11875 [Sedimentisphaerales bacterium]|nr:hypothetical protein [Sedimentisphaerales bacterium]
MRVLQNNAQGHWCQMVRKSALAAAVLVVLHSHGLWGQSSTAAQVAQQPRPFCTGFTAFPYDLSMEAVEQTRRFVRDNADLIAHHIEGVPWAEALCGAPFPKEVLDDHQSKRSMKPPGAKVYLAVSPGRGDLKLPDRGATPLPPELKGRSYDDPLVKRAFLTYCRHCIDFFQPDYMAIGIEVNEIFSADVAKWHAYVELHRYIYGQVKKEHPGLPVFASFTLHNMIKDRGPMLAAWEELMPFNDLVAVSYYPFLAGEPADQALAWMTDRFDRFGKPYAMVETNDAGDRLVFPQSRIVIDGTPEKQAAYVRTLLRLAEQHRFVFVVLFIHRDYDALWDKIKATAPELFMAWRDCGLVDEQGNARPAYAVWREYFERPFEEETKKQ